MDNPFEVNGYLLPNASINKLFIEKIPTNNLYQDLQGKMAGEIFSSYLFIEEIRKKSNKLKIDSTNIDDKLLPQCLESCLDSQVDSIRILANNIVKEFGERLGVILLTLKKGEAENREKRPEWNDENWNYWTQLESVILVGGLASGKFGEIFKRCIYKVFRDEKVEPYNIILYENSSQAGILGCSRYIKNPQEDKFNLVFDFGQSFIKRSLVNINDGKANEIITLDKVKSESVQWEFEKNETEQEEAKKLNKFLINIISETINYCNENNYKIGGEIAISVANYVKNGQFTNRGGYGKLRLIASNYEEYLKVILRKKFNSDFEVKMIHDGTAMAAGFNEYSNSVCISLGTALGVGFTKDN